MQIKAQILVHRFEQHKSLYSYKLLFDQDCTATHGKFPNKESARTHAEVLAKRIRVSLKWENEMVSKNYSRGHDENVISSIICKYASYKQTISKL